MSSRVSGRIFERHPKKTLAAIIVAAALIADFIAAQLVTRPGREKPDQQNETVYRSRHPVYHHTLRANVDSHDARWGPLDFPISTNSLGFKDRAPRRVPSQPAGPRIVLIGDSFTEGSGFAYQDTFAGLVDAALSARGIEVLNAGVTSYSPIIYLRKIEYLMARGFDFDHLLVFIDLSDIHDEYFDYKFDEARNVVDRFPIQKVVNVREILTDNSLIYRSVRLTMRKLRHTRKAARKADQAGLAINHDKSEWTISDEVFASWGAEGLERAAVHMDALARLADSQGFALTIAVYPWPDQIFYRDLDSKQVKFWRDWAKNNGAGFMNYFPAFISEEKAPGETIRRFFIDGDVHWNEAGHRLIAAGVLAQLAPELSGESVRSSQPKVNKRITRKSKPDGKTR